VLRLPFRALWPRSHTIRSHRPARRLREALRLEELESRALPSVSPPAGWTASPLLDGVTPLAGASGTSAYTPSQIRSAYGFNNLPYDGAGQTIAIVDAFDDPTIAADLAAFDKHFGLAAPPSFVKATPQGRPATDADWSTEIALDVEWAHVIAPRANILLVEAKTSNWTDLLNAVDYARHQPGVVVVSMSWGSPEFSGERGTDATFTTPGGHNGVVFIASAGDAGAAKGPEWPSVSPNVVAVGGTALHLSGNGYGSEAGWTGGGGGYSKFEARPSYQQGFQGSTVRTTPDVAYNADRKTGVHVYRAGRWYSVGGTSAGAPQWAGLVALADQARGGAGALDNLNPLLYALPGADFHDVTTGSNRYAAKVGYDLVTGRGTPYADRVVRDLVGVTPNKNASAAGHRVTPPSSRKSVISARYFDAGYVLGTGETAAGTERLSLCGPSAVSVPAAPTPDRVWVAMSAQAPAGEPHRHGAMLLCPSAPPALYWTPDGDVSLDSDAEM
jgi:subtilase family serine protease